MLVKLLEMANKLISNKKSNKNILKIQIKKLPIKRKRKDK